MLIQYLHLALVYFIFLYHTQIVSLDFNYKLAFRSHHFNGH